MQRKATDVFIRLFEKFWPLWDKIWRSKRVTRCAMLLFYISFKISYLSILNSFIYFRFAAKPLETPLKWHLFAANS
tara:strand:+ start:3114 stop:3341 length:228 start_codon:yes stop_codon:yes gene_type:complete